MPAPLVVAASLVAVEGLLLLGYAVLLLASARAVARGQSWGRSPIVLTQLIQLGLAWSFRDGSTLLVAVALAVIALVVLAGILNPASIDALSRADEQR